MFPDMKESLDQVNKKRKRRPDSYRDASLSEICILKVK
jgi:hypothetical protein